MNGVGPDRPFLPEKRQTEGRASHTFPRPSLMHVANVLPLRRLLPPPPRGSVGIKEIGGVEPFSRIRHGQCSPDWTEPPGGESRRAE